MIIVIMIMIMMNTSQCLDQIQKPLPVDEINYCFKKNSMAHIMHGNHVK
jgi:hypothetical protein